MKTQDVVVYHGNSQRPVFCVSGTLALAMSAAVVPWLGVIRPAAAAPEECIDGANGFADIPTHRIGKLVGKAWIIPLGPSEFNVRISLRHGTVAGVHRGWALISGSTIPGDRVWMDWTTDGGWSWVQCGPWPVFGNGEKMTSLAQRTDDDALWQFRACGDLVGVPDSVTCTDWW